MGTERAEERDGRFGEVLLKDDARFSMLFEQASVGVAQIDTATGVFVRINRQYCDIVGYSREEMVGMSFHTITFPDDLAADLAQMERLKAGEITQMTLEKRYVHKAGHLVWVELTVSPLWAPGNVPDFHLAIVRDITARKEAWEAQTRIFERISDAFVALDPDCRYTYVNKKAEETLGRRREDLIGEQPWAELPGPVGERLKLAFERAMAEQRTIALEDYYPLRDRWLEHRIYPSPEGLTVYFLDISERKRAEEALRRSEESLTVTLQSIGEAVIATDASFSLRISRMNPTAERLTGWALREAVSRPLAEVFNVVDAETRRPVVDRVRRALDGEPVVAVVSQMTLLARDGRDRQVAASASPIRDSQGQVLGAVLVFADVTDQYAAQRALRESELRLRTIIELEPECVKLVDRDGKLLELNRAGLAMFEADSLEDAQKRSLTDFVVPSDRAAFVDLHRRVMTGETGTLEFGIVGLKGNARSLATHAAPMRNAEGEITALLGVTHDITQRKIADEERRALELRLQRSQKMESLGNLAGGVAHDMNNVLAAILSLASLHLEIEAPNGRLRETFETITKACSRGAELVKGLLAFARTGLAKAQEVDLNALVRDEVQLLGHTTLSKVRLETHLAEDLKPIRGDASTLSHALMNLCINAVDAMPVNGVLTLRTRNEGDRVVVEVEDAGTGMTEDVLAKAMEPFFTTKAQGKGTGLGLSIVYSTVNAHQGRIEVSSKPGIGTRVVLSFPSCEASPALDEAPQDYRPVSPAHRLKVLLVDDDGMVRRAMARLLDKLNCEATPAESGEEALAIVAAGFAPDLVVMDVNMPGLGGAGTLPRFRARCPSVPVLLTTGKPDKQVMELTRAYEGVSVLAKPFTVQEMRQSLASVVRSPIPKSEIPESVARLFGGSTESQSAPDASRRK